jgi:TRAP-type C4-dicarboxylate transport system permease small subunit
MTSAMLGTMILCFALSVSVAVSIGLSAILGIQVVHANMLLSVKEMFNSINKFPLAAIPFFILAGNLMESGGISRRLVEFAKSIVGGVQGGLPMTCVLTCMIFAAVSGSSVATTFAIGAILIRLSLIWMVFLGIPVAFRQGAMVSVDVLYRWSPPKMRRALDWLVCLASLSLIAVILWWGWDYAVRGQEQAMAGLESISMFWGYVAMPVGAVFSIFGIVGNFLDPQRHELETAQ